MPPDIPSRLVPRRRKIALACEPCRERKSRCDGTKPICGGCERRGIPLEQCLFYTVDNARTASNDAYLKLLHDRIRVLEQTCARNGVEVPSLDAQAAEALPILSRNYHSKEHYDVEDSSHSVSAMGTISTGDEWKEALEETPEFYGSSSAASFMKEAYRSMSTSSPQDSDRSSTSAPRKTTDIRVRTSGRPAVRFQTAATPFITAEAYVLPPPAFAEHILSRFWDRVYPLYPFFHRPSFETAYETVRRGTEHPTWDAQHAGLGLGINPGAGAGTLVFQAALNFVFALGCYFADMSPQERLVTAASFINRAKACVTMSMMEMNNLGLVQTLLLMVIVSQATPYPNRCWNALGVGTRMAQGLGFYTDRESKSGQSPLEVELRRRTWHCLVAFDQLVGMTYGRPAMTPHNTIDLPLPSPFKGEDTLIPESKTTTLVTLFSEYIRLSSLLGEVASRVYRSAKDKPSPEQKSPAGLDVIVDLESKLSQFETSVPPALSWKPTRFDKTAMEAKRRAILEEQSTVLHGRFLYLRLMLHRPVLSQYYHTSTTTKDDDPYASATVHDIYGSFAEESARVCFRSAMDLLDLVHSTYLTDKSGGWWWDGFYACTAGLVLLVGQLCPSLVDDRNAVRVQQSWAICQEILGHLASFCPPVEKTLGLLQRMHGKVAMRRPASAAGNVSDFTNLSNLPTNAVHFDTATDPFTQLAFEQYTAHPDSWMIGHGPPDVKMQEDYQMEWNPAFDIGFLTDGFGLDVMNWDATGLGEVSGCADHREFGEFG